VGAGGTSGGAQVVTDGSVSAPDAYGNVTQAAPVLGEVTPEKTVQGQLGKILQAGNPLLEAAKARAMKQAASRGLVNTSVAAQAGEEAIVNQALPIAQQDASTYYNQGIANQDVQNKFAENKFAEDSRLKLQYETFKQNNVLFDKDEKLKRYLNDSSISSEEKRATWANSTALQVAQSNYNASVDTESLRAAVQRYSAELGLQGTKYSADMQKTLNQINNDTTLRTNFASMQVNTIYAYTNQLAGILTSEGTQAEKDAKIEALNAAYAGNPYYDPKGATIYPKGP
jgi:hypothetical protein